MKIAADLLEASDDCTNEWRRDSASIDDVDPLIESLSFVYTNVTVIQEKRGRDE